MLVDMLRRTLAAQQVRHAYLFSGPEHIGKSLLARCFAAMPALHWWPRSNRGTSVFPATPVSLVARCSTAIT